MSGLLPNTTIDSIHDSKNHVLFNQSTQNSKFYKYISGDKVVYDYYILRDPNAPLGSTHQYAQIYYRDKVAYITSPNIRLGEISADLITASSINVLYSSTFGRNINVLSGGIHATGNVTFNGNLFVQNNFILDENLFVQGDTTMVGNLSVEGNFISTGFATFGSGLYIQDGISLSGVYNINLNAPNSLNIEAIGRTGTINIGSNDLTRIINIGSTNNRLEQINIGVGGHGPGDPSTIINIGSPGDIVNINASANIISVSDYKILNNHVVINGVSGIQPFPIDTSDIGILFSDGVRDFAGYFVTDPFTGNYFELKAPNNNFVLRFPILYSNSRVIHEDDITLHTNVNNLYVTSNISTDNLTVRNNAQIQNELDVLSGASFHNDVNISGKLIIATSTEIYGGLLLYNNLLNNGNIINTGNVSIDGYVTISGNTTFTNADISIDKNVKIGNDLFVRNSITTDSISITNHATIKNGLTLSGGANVIGDVNFLDSDLFVSGTVSISGDVKITGNMSVFGDNFIVNSELFLDRNAFFDQSLSVNTLNVTSNTLIHGNLEVKNNATITNNLSVDTINVSNNTLIHGNLFTIGDVSFTNDLYVNNKLVVNSDQNTKGNMILDGAFQAGNIAFFNKGIIVDESATFQGDLFVQETINTQNQNLTGNMNINGKINILGEMIITGKTIINGFDLEGVTKGLNITGNATFNKSIVNIEGILNINTTGLVVTGNVTFCVSSFFIDGFVGITGGLTVTGNVTMSDNLSVKELNVSNNTNIDGGLIVLSPGTFNSEVSISGLQVTNNLLVFGNSKFLKQVDISGLTISNNISISGSLFVFSGATFSNTVFISGLHVSNNLLLNNNLIVNGISNFNNKVNMGEGFTVTGEVIVNGNIKAFNDVTISGMLLVSGNGLIVTGQSIFNNSIILNSKFRYIESTFDKSSRISSTGYEYYSVDISKNEMYTAFPYMFKNVDDTTINYLGLLVANNINVSFNNSFPQYIESIGSQIQLTGSFENLAVNFTTDSSKIYIYHLFDSLYTIYFAQYDDINKWGSRLTQTGLPGGNPGEIGPFDISTFPDVSSNDIKSSRFTTAFVDPSRKFTTIKLNYTGLYSSGSFYVDSNDLVLNGNIHFTGNYVLFDSSVTFNHTVSFNSEVEMNKLFVTGSTTFFGDLSASGKILLTGSITMGQVYIGNAIIDILDVKTASLGNPVISDPVVFYNGAQAIGNIDPVSKPNTLSMNLSVNNGVLSLADDDFVKEISIGLGPQSKEIFIGSPLDTITIAGTLKMAQVGQSTQISNLELGSKILALNVPETLGTIIDVRGAGLQICDGISLEAGYIVSDLARGDHYVMKAPKAPVGGEKIYELSFPVLTTTSTLLIKDDATNTLIIEKINALQQATFNSNVRINGTLDVQGNNHVLNGITRVSTINVAAQANILDANVSNNLNVAQNAFFSNSILTVSGILNVSGGVVVTGSVTFANLNVDGKASIDFLEVKSSATFDSDVSIVSHDAKIVEGTLQIINGGMFVNSGEESVTNKSVILQSTVDILGRLNVTGSVMITGNTTFNKNIFVNEKATVYDLVVLNNVALGSINNINGFLYVDGGFSLTGGGTFSDSIVVEKTATINKIVGNTLISNGNATFKSNIDIVGILNVSGGMNVTSNSNFNNLYVNKSSTFNAGLFISGSTIIGNTQNYNTPVNIFGNLNISGNGLKVTGLADIQSLNVSDNTILDTLIVKNNITFENSYLSMSGAFDLTGRFIFSGSATMDKVFTKEATINFLTSQSIAKFESGMITTGNATFLNSILSVDGGLIVSKTATFNHLAILDNLNLSKGLIVNQETTFNGSNNYFEGKMIMNDSASFNDSVYINNNLSVGSNVSITGHINMNQIGIITTDNINKLVINTQEPGSTIDIGTDANSTNIRLGSENGSLKTITIGGDNNTVNLVGDINYLGTIHANDLTIINGTINNKKIFLNTTDSGNVIHDVYDVGIGFSDGIDNQKGYFKTDTIHGDHFVFKAPYNKQYELSTPILTTTSTIAIIDDETNTLTIDNLQVNGSVTFDGNVVFDNMIVKNTAFIEHLHISGNTTFNDSNIFMNGALNISGTLKVTGQALINSLTNVEANIKDLNVSRTATFNSDVYIDNNLNVFGNITVTGNANFSNISINTSDFASLKVNGNSTFNNTINVSGGILAITGGSTFGSINVRNITVTDIHILESSYFQNKINILGGIDAFTGNTTFGFVNVLKGIDITGSVNIQSNNILISGIVSITGGMIVTGTSVFSNAMIHDSELRTMNVLGNATFSDSNVFINGLLNITGGLTVTGTTKISTIVINNANADSLFIHSNSTFNSSLYISGNMNVSNGYISTNNLLVKGSVTLNNLVITNNFFASASSTFNKNLYIHEQLLVNNGLYVNNNVTFNNSILNISGKAFLNDKSIVTINQLKDTNVEVHLYQLDDSITNLDILTGNHLFVINNTILNTISGVDSGVLGTAYTILVDDQMDLVYVGGSFVNVNGIAATGIAIYDNNINQWFNIGDGVDGTVKSIARDENLLYIGGTFLTAGGIYATGIVQYDRTLNSWHNLGHGLTGTVNSIAIDSNNLVYVGGTFIDVDTIKSTGISQWNNTSQSWLNLADGIDGTVNTIAIDNNDLVYVGGSFTTAGTISTKGIAIWNNTDLSWTSLGLGVDGTVNSIAIDSNNLVYVGGSFIQAGPILRNGIAVWNNSEKSWIGLVDDINGTINSINFDALENIFIGGSFNYRVNSNITHSENIIYYNKAKQDWNRLLIDGVHGVKGNIVALDFDKYNNLYLSAERITQAGTLSPLNSFLKIESIGKKTLRFNGPLRYLDNSGNLTITDEIVLDKLGENVRVYYNTDSNTGFIISKSNSGFNTIYVKGNAEFNDTILNISGSIQLKGDLIVTGDASIAGNLLINGNQTINNLDVVNNSTFGNNIYIHNDLIVNRNLQVSGITDIFDNLTVSGSLYVSGTEFILTGNSILGGNVSIDGALNLNNDLTITGDINQNGVFTISGGLLISGSSPCLIATGDVIFDNSNIYISGRLTTTGDAIFDNSNVSINGGLFVTGNTTFNQCNLSVSGGFVLTGNATFNQGQLSLIQNNLLVINSSVTFINVTMNLRGLLVQTGGFIAGGKSTFINSVNINGGLFVTGNATFSASILSISGGLNSIGNVNISGDITLTGNISCSGIATTRGFIVHGNSSFNSGFFSISGLGVIITGNVTMNNGLTVDTTLSVGTNKFVLDNNGFVGIGVSNPMKRLTIVGTVDSTSKEISIGANYPVSTLNERAGALSFYSNNNSVEFARIESCNNIGGSDNNGDLRFFTRFDSGNTGERMRIDRSGNVGIGTTTSSGGWLGGNYRTRIVSDTTVYPLNIHYANSGGGNSMIDFSSDRYNSTGNRIDAVWQFGLSQSLSPSDNDVFFVGRAGFSSKEFVLNRLGNVGIGSDRPQFKLDLDGDFRVSNRILVQNNLSNADIEAYQNSNSAGNYSILAQAKDSSNGLQKWLWQLSSSGDYQLIRNYYNGSFFSDSKMFFKGSNGFLGINTSDPQYTLDVNGDLRVSGSIIGTGSGTTTTSSTSIDNITIPTISQGFVQFAQIFSTYGAYILELSIVVSDNNLGLSKKYIIPITWKIENNNIYYRVIPIADSGSFGPTGQQIFELLIMTSVGTLVGPGDAYNAVANLRIRRLSGDVPGIASVTIYIQSDSSDVPLVQQVSSSSIDSTNYDVYSYTQLIQQGQTGFVGIGTTNPRNKLHIQGTDDNGIYLDSINGNATLAFNTPFSSGSINFKGATNDRAMQFNNSTAGLSNTSNLFTWYSDTIGFGMVLNNSGFLGIGTTNPSSKIQIEGASNNATMLVMDTNGYNSTVSYGNNSALRWFAQSLGNAVESADGEYRYRIFQVGMASDEIAERFTIKKNGNVGIGTSNPIVKLDVRSDGVFGIRVKRSTPGENRVLIEDNVGNGWSWANGLVTQGDFSLAEENRTGNVIYVKKTSGCVGFGMSNPTRHLEVTSTDKIPFFFSGNILAGDANSGGAEIRHWDGTSGIGFGWNTIYAAGSDTNQLLRLSAKGDLLFNTGYVERMRILGSNGNVGIGTTNPDTALVIRRDFNGNSPNQIVIRGTATNQISEMAIGMNTISHFGSIQPLLQGIQYKPLALCPIDGNVGIGTTNPVSKLHIYGTYGDTGITVQNTSPFSTMSFLFLRTDTSGDFVLFKNNSASTNEGGGSTATIRNNNGSLRLLTTAGSNGDSQIGVHIVPSSPGNTFLGIGKSNPQYKLDVEGAAHFNSSLYDKIRIRNYNSILHFGDIDRTTSVARIMYNWTRRDESGIPAGGEAGLYGRDSSNFGRSAISFLTHGDIDFMTESSNLNPNAIPPSRMVISNKGNVGIGTGVPQTALVISRDDGSDYFPSQLVIQSTSNTNSQLMIGMNTDQNYGVITPVVWGGQFKNLILCPLSGNIGIGKTDPGFQLDLSTDGARKLTTTTWQTGCDIRVKEEVEFADLDLCYTTIKNMKLRRFTWKEKYYKNIHDRRVVGFIAQEVKEVFPKAVIIQEERICIKEPIVVGTTIEKRGEYETISDFHTLDIDQINKTLFGAVQKLMKEVENLKKDDESNQYLVDDSHIDDKIKLIKAEVEELTRKNISLEQNYNSLLENIPSSNTEQLLIHQQEIQRLNNKVVILTNENVSIKEQLEFSNNKIDDLSTKLHKISAILGIEL